MSRELKRELASLQLPSNTKTFMKDYLKASGYNFLPLCVENEFRKEPKHLGSIQEGDERLELGIDASNYSSANDLFKRTTSLPIIESKEKNVKLNVGKISRKIRGLSNVFSKFSRASSL